MSYERTIEMALSLDVSIRFSRTGRPIERYAVILVVFTRLGWQTARVFDNHQGTHHMHRYTPKDGKQPPVPFHTGPTNEAIAAAIQDLKDHWEAIIEPWRT